MMKKTFAGISKKFELVMKECEILEKQTDTEIAIIATKEEELQRKREHQEDERNKARMLGGNLKKLMTEKL